MSDFTEPPLDPEDAKELDNFKSRITGRLAYDILQAEPAYNQGFKKYAVYQYDERTGLTVINEFFFADKEVAKQALEHAKSLRDQADNAQKEET